MFGGTTPFYFCANFRKNDEVGQECTLLCKHLKFRELCFYFGLFDCLKKEARQN